MTEQRSLPGENRESCIQLMLLAMCVQPLWRPSSTAEQRLDCQMMYVLPWFATVSNQENHPLLAACLPVPVQPC